jgi:hypothetical protein
VVEPSTRACKRSAFRASPTMAWPSVRIQFPATQTHCPTAETKKDLQTSAFSEAAEGIRTLDLLHGKQNVRSRASQESPGKEGFPSYTGSAMLPSFTAKTTGVSGLKPDWGSCGFGRRLRSRTVGAHPATRSWFAGGGRELRRCSSTRQQPALANRQPADALAPPLREAGEQLRLARRHVAWASSMPTGRSAEMAGA